MAQKTLSDILVPREEHLGSLRWEVTVPLGTNPFILVELFQFSFVSGAVAALLIGTGVWATKGGSVTGQEIVVAISTGGLLMAGVMAGFIAISFVFFSNRYYSVYRMDSVGVYHEGSRGKDERREWLSLRVKPYPVIGQITPERTRSKHLLWEKVDRYHGIPSMRTIILRRGMWHLLRLYMPDDATYRKAMEFLSQNLQKY